jgi:hypothetical protein
VALGVDQHRVGVAVPELLGVVPVDQHANQQPAVARKLVERGSVQDRDDIDVGRVGLVRREAAGQPLTMHLDQLQQRLAVVGPVLEDRRPGPRGREPVDQHLADVFDGGGMPTLGQVAGGIKGRDAHARTGVHRAAAPNGGAD